MSTLLEQLQTIYDERGDLTPSLVVDEARDNDHPLHARFDWIDTTAAESWRREQASGLIRSVRIKWADSPNGPQDLRAFVAIKSEESHQSSYTPTEQAMADPFLRSLVLRDMEREWRSLKKRYEHMAEFADLIRREIEGTAS
jgi:hypothetical protein